jgi:hypothetical protein
MRKPPMRFPRWNAALLAAVVALLTTGFAVSAQASTALPAAAAAQKVVHSASSGHRPGASPDVNNFVTYTDPDQTGFSDDYPCIQGFDYTPSNWPILVPVESAVNNCEYRVYLQYANGTSDCINPDTPRNNIEEKYWYPDGVMIGNSEDPC